MDLKDILLFIILSLLLVLTGIWIVIGYFFLRWHRKNQKEAKERFANCLRQSSPNEISQDIILKKDADPTEFKGSLKKLEKKLYKGASLSEESRRDKPTRKDSKSKSKTTSNTSSLFQINKENETSEKRRTKTNESRTDKKKIENIAKNKSTDAQLEIFTSNSSNRNSKEVSKSNRSSETGLYPSAKSTKITPENDFNDIIDLTEIKVEPNEEKKKISLPQKTANNLVSNFSNAGAYEQNQKIPRKDAFLAKKRNFRNKDSGMTVRNSIYAGDLHLVTTSSGFDDNRTAPVGTSVNLNKKSFLSSVRHKPRQDTSRESQPPPLPSAEARSSLDELKARQQKQVPTGYVDMKINTDEVSSNHSRGDRTQSDAMMKQDRFQTTAKSISQSRDLKKLNRRSMSFSGVPLKHNIVTSRELHKIAENPIVGYPKKSQKLPAENKKPFFDDEKSDYVHMDWK